MPLARIKLIWKFSETPITEEVQLHMAAKVAKIEEKQESLEKQVLISGSLTARDGSQINYWPIEVSQFSISIITDFSPSQVLDALLTGPQGSIELLQIKALSNYRSSGYFYIQFRARRKLLSIEEALRYVSELKGWNSRTGATDPIKLSTSGSFVRAARFDVHQDLSVNAKTFGTTAEYHMKAKNVSKSGLLVLGRGELPPFKEGTIVEIVIDPAKQYFSQTIACLAKVVRADIRVNLNDLTEREARFALHLIELDQGTLNLWCNFVDQIEEDSIEFTK